MRHPVLVQTYPEDGFAMNADAFLHAITPSTKAIVINSPCNPTGALMAESEMHRLVTEVANQNIWIILDLCYEQLIYDPVPHNLVGILTERMRDHTIVTGSASKSYAMTGWRCGWALGPADVIAACNALQSHSTSNVSSISQKAALAALTGPQESVTAMLAEYRARRDQSARVADRRIPHHVLEAGGRVLLVPRHLGAALARRHPDVRPSSRRGCSTRRTSR